MTQPFSPLLTLSNGVEIPRLGLGVFRSEGDETLNAVAWALEAGYRHIDTAAAYFNEEAVGKGIRQSGVKREDIFITTKLSSKEIEEGRYKEPALKSMELLGVGYLDLFLIHWPCKNCMQAWEALTELYEEKKIRAIGVSNYEIEHLKLMADRGYLTPAVNQIELHPSFQQKKLKDYCASKGITVEAWAPLGGTDFSVLENPVLKAIAGKHGKTAAQTVIRWHIQYGNVVIPKSKNRERIIMNGGVFDFELDGDDMSKIAVLETGKRSYWDPWRFWVDP
jgi:diketogulonate reductase-like aldo/keto reductase